MMLGMVRVVSFALLLLAACGSSAPTPVAPPASSPPPVTPATPDPADASSAPQLFTLAQLRDGNPAGRVIELRIEMDGKPAMIERMEFTASDATSATIHSITRDDAGAVLADETGTATWTELHGHGRFPAAATTIEDGVSITVPAGTFTTRLYTVTADGATRRFWFATTLPGPPVQFTTEQGGKVVMRAQMLRAR